MLLSDDNHYSRRLVVTAASAFGACFLLGSAVTRAALPMSQLAFSLAKTDTFLSFRYSFPNHNGNRLDLTFQLPNSALEALHFVEYGGEELTQAISEAQGERLNSQDVKARFNAIKNKYPSFFFDLKFQDGNVKITYGYSSVLTNTDVQKLKTLVQTELEETNNEIEAIKVDVFKENGFMVWYPGLYVVDGPKYARNQVDILRPLAEALGKTAKIGDERLLLENALAFFQSIPYDALHDRRTGFVTPVGLLVGNRGDCDSKSCAFLAVVTSLFPRAPRIYILLKNHALVGLAVPPNPSDTSLMYEGVSYVLMEPVGPDLRPVGSISSSTRSELSAGRDVLVVPA